MNLYTAINKTDTIAEELISNLRKVKAEELGLDPRAGYRLYVDHDVVGVRTCNIGTLNYYGGFEYVDKEDIKVIGEYTFFLTDSERIQDCIDTLEANDD